MYKITKAGRKFIVDGPKGRYAFADKRRAFNVAEGLARNTMTVETADKLQALDRKQFA